MQSLLSNNKDDDEDDDDDENDCIGISDKSIGKQ